MGKARKVIKISRRQAKEELWRRGRLEWILRPEQREIYTLLRKAVGLKYTLYCARRFGKSFICMLMAIEDCLRNQGWEIGFVAPTQMNLKRIYRPIMDTILRDCPKAIRPAWKADFNGFYFPSTKSILFMSGTDNKRYEDLRGMNLHKGYFDEPGSMDDLNVIINSIVQPQTLTTKEDRGEACGIILLGTPSSTPAHDYYFIKERCKSEGNFAKRIIYDNSSLSKETIDEYIEEAGGMEHSTCRREYFCEDIIDVERAVIPEFDGKKEEELVKEKERPDHYQLYGGLDPGHINDKLGYLLGYYNFLGGYFYIEGELKLDNVPTDVMYNKIVEVENRVFPNKKIFLRFSDTESQIIRDLNLMYGLEVCPTSKDNKFAQINGLRNLIKQNRVFIHPRCKHLIRQLKTVIWDKNKTKFEYNDNEGHFDLIDALLYLIRNIDEYHNPYPHKWDGISGDNSFVPSYRKEQHAGIEEAILGV